MVETLPEEPGWDKYGDEVPLRGGHGPPGEAFESVITGERQNQSAVLVQPFAYARCSQTGYRGRDAVAETLELTPDLIQAVERGAPVEELRSLAVAGGMRTMAADAVRRAAEGKTSLAEIMRVFGPT